MANTTTRKELFTRIAETMANDTEVVAMCEKYIEQLSKPRPKKENKEVMEFRSKVLTLLTNATEPMTNKEVAAEFEVSPQKSSAALRFLVAEGVVERIEGEKKTAPATFKAKAA